jgi:hypothetical protein
LLAHIAHIQPLSTNPSQVNRMTLDFIEDYENRKNRLFPGGTREVAIFSIFGRKYADDSFALRMPFLSITEILRSCDPRD